MRRCVKTDVAPENKIKISFTGNFPATVLNDFIPLVKNDLAQYHPTLNIQAFQNVQVDVNRSNPELKEHGYDFGVFCSPIIPNEDLGIVPWVSFPRIIVGSVSLLKTLPPINFPLELPPHLLLSSVEDTWLFSKHHQTEQIKLRSNRRFVSDQELLKMAVMGAGIVNISSLSLKQTREPYALRRILPDWHCGEPTDFSFVFEYGELKCISELFFELLHDYACAWEFAERTGHDLLELLL